MHDGAAAGVHAEGDVPFGDFFHNGLQPRPFFFGGNVGGAGAGGFAADVENVRAFGQQAFGMGEGGAGAAGISAAVGEGIGGEVDDAHDFGRG